MPMLITKRRKIFDIDERVISFALKRDDLERMCNDLTVDLDASVIGNNGRYNN